MEVLIAEMLSRHGFLQKLGRYEAAKKQYALLVHSGTHIIYLYAHMYHTCVHLVLYIYMNVQYLYVHIHAYTLSQSIHTSKYIHE